MRECKNTQNICLVLLTAKSGAVFWLSDFQMMFALHMSGKKYIMEQWTKKSESTNI